MSHLIKVYTFCKFSYYRFWYLRSKGAFNSSIYVCCTVNFCNHSFLQFETHNTSLIKLPCTMPINASLSGFDSSFWRGGRAGVEMEGGNGGGEAGAVGISEESSIYST